MASCLKSTVVTDHSSAAIWQYRFTGGRFVHTGTTGGGGLGLGGRGRSCTLQPKLRRCLPVLHPDHTLMWQHLRQLTHTWQLCCLIKLITMVQELVKTRWFWQSLHYLVHFAQLFGKRVHFCHHLFLDKQENSLRFWAIDPLCSLQGRRFRMLYARLLIWHRSEKTGISCFTSVALILYS